MNKHELLLNKIYYEEKNFDGVNALYIKAKLRDKSITLKIIKEWLKNQTVSQQTSRKIEKKKYLPIYSEISNAFQIDLTFLPKYKKQNDGYHVLFTAININTRYVYAYYGKDRKLNTLLEFLKTFQKHSKINFIVGDLEFKKNNLLKYLEENKIGYDFYKADSHKLGIINRFHRTLKEKINKYFIANNTVRWIDVIDEIIYNYNRTFHNGIKTTPHDVNTLIEMDIIYEKKKETKEIKENEEQYLKGDFVRVKQTKSMFEKNKAIYSHDIYVIKKVENNSVIVLDLKNNEHKFKKSKLLKISNETINNEVDKIKNANKEGKIDRFIKKEGLDLNNIIETKRIKSKPKIKLN